jgi:hypothetical protein
MTRWTSGLQRLGPDAVAVGSVAVVAVLLVGAFGVAEATVPVRGASIAAAGCFLLLVAVGVSLYAWRLGASGHSD